MTRKYPPASRHLLWTLSAFCSTVVQSRHHTGRISQSFFDVDLLFLLGYVQLTKLLAESLGVCADKSEDLLNIGIRELRDILVEKCIRLLFASYRIMTFGEYFSMSERLLLLNALHLLLLLGFPNVRKNCIVRSHSLFASANDCGASSKEVITFGSPLMLSPN